MKISKVLETPSIVILLFILEREEVRHGDFTEIINSRGTLSNNLRELEDEELILRRVVSSKPIQSYYSLTEQGKQVAMNFIEISKTLIESKHTQN